MARADRATWAKRVERWKRCGLRATEYAATIGVNPRTLSYWRWRLGTAARREPARKVTAEIVRRSSAKGPGPGAPVTPEGRATPSVALSFIEVARSDVESLHEPFELVLADGVRVRVPSAFDGPALARLLEVVERRR